MKGIASILVATAAAVNAQLDIPAILAQAVPALPTDPRFKDYRRPGKGDGMLTQREIAHSLIFHSSLSLPWTQFPCQPWVWRLFPTCSM